MDYEINKRMMKKADGKHPSAFLFSKHFFYNGFNLRVIKPATRRASRIAASFMKLATPFLRLPPKS